MSNFLASFDNSIQISQVRGEEVSQAPVVNLKQDDSHNIQVPQLVADVFPQEDGVSDDEVDLLKLGGGYTGGSSDTKSESVNSVASVPYDSGDQDVINPVDPALAQYFDNQLLVDCQDPIPTETFERRVAFIYRYAIDRNCDANSAGESGKIKQLLNSIHAVIISNKIKICDVLVQINNEVNLVKSLNQCYTILKSLGASVGVWDCMPFLCTGVVSNGIWTIPGVGTVDMTYFPYYFQVTKIDGSIKNFDRDVQAYLEKKSWSFRSNFFTSCAYYAGKNVQELFKGIMVPIQFSLILNDKMSVMQRYVLTVMAFAKNRKFPKVLVEGKEYSLCDFIATRIKSVSKMQDNFEALKGARDLRVGTVLDTLLKELYPGVQDRYNLLLNGSPVMYPSVVHKFKCVEEHWRKVSQVVAKRNLSLKGNKMILAYVGVTSDRNLQVSKAISVASELNCKLHLGDRKLTGVNHVDLDDAISVAKWLKGADYKLGDVVLVHCDTADTSVSNSNSAVTENHVKNLMLAGCTYVTIKANAFCTYKMNYTSSIMMLGEEIATGRAHNGEIIICASKATESVCLPNLYQSKHSVAVQWQQVNRDANACRGLVYDTISAYNTLNINPYTHASNIKAIMPSSNLNNCAWQFDDKEDNIHVTELVDVGGKIIQVYQNEAGYYKLRLTNCQVANLKQFFDFIKIALRFKVYVKGLGHDNVASIPNGLSFDSLILFQKNEFE